MNQYDLGNWVHWTIVKDGDNLRIYKNAIAIVTPDDFIIHDAAHSSLTGFNSMVWNAPGVNGRLGAMETYGSYLNGVLDDVRIYNRALTANEVSQIYNGGSGTEAE